MKTPISRRTLLKQGALAAAAAALPGRASAAAAAPAAAPAAPAPVSHNRFPRMLHEYNVRLVREAAAVGERRRARLRTKADAEACVRDVRERVRQSLGPWPEKTPLHARVTGTLDRGTYAIEKIVFESRPGFFVTANLYVPAAARRQRRPGVVLACGHYPEGKAAEPYQSVAQGLARLGYVVLIFDPIGQGERLQYLDAQFRSVYNHDSLDEHLQAGNQQVLVGESLAAWRAWDGVRALDYLLTRPEVDPAHVGVTGNSGGGTDTTWLCAVEDRWTMAAPQCFVTTFRRILENEMPADPEQCPPRAMALGLDLDDFVAVMAPRPLALLGQEKDFFDARGLEEAHARLQRLYELLGAPQNLRLVISPDYHSFSPPSREALYRWFNRATGADENVTEPALTLENPADLLCTPQGQVGQLPGARYIHDFTREKAEALAQKRPAPDGDALRRAVRAVLRLPAAAGVPDYRILRPERPRGFPRAQAAVYAVETEPDLFALVYRLDDRERIVSRPPRTGPRAVLYVCDRSSDEELRLDPWVRELVAGTDPHEPFFTCDPRLSGESRPNTCNKPHTGAYGADYMYAAHGLMLDRPIAGQRTHDVLQVLRWLEANGHTEVHLVAAGWGAVPAVFAALFAGNVTRVTLRHALTSYAEVAATPAYNWPLHALPPNVLGSFDLPDCYRALEAKQLRLVEPWGARSPA